MRLLGAGTRYAGRGGTLPPPKPAPTGSAAASFNRRRRLNLSAILSLLIQIVPNDESTFHHEFDSLHLAHIRKRITRNGNDVGELTFFDTSDLIVPIVVQQVRGRQERRLQGLASGHSPLGIVSELICLV